MRNCLIVLLLMSLPWLVPGCKHHSKRRVTNFTGNYYYLNNSYPSTVIYQGRPYPSIDCALRALPPCSAGERLYVLDTLVRQKFETRCDLRIRLIETGDCDLIDGRGDNRLGRALMCLRDQLHHREHHEDDKSGKGDDAQDDHNNNGDDGGASDGGNGGNGGNNDNSNHGDNGVRDHGQGDGRNGHGQGQGNDNGHGNGGQGHD